MIYKEGVSIHGLTTAASIWITAAIGILLGVGFYFPAMLATVLVLGILSAFRWIEARMPSESYASHYIRFEGRRRCQKQRSARSWPSMALASRT